MLAARAVGHRMTAKIASHKSPKSSLASTRNETTKVATPTENTARDNTTDVYVLRRNLWMNRARANSERG